MFLITGCGRSGTRYIAQALRRCGLDVDHEKPGRDGMSSYYYCFDTDWYPGSSHPVPRLEFDVILHQIRYPLDVIASLLTTSSWNWVCQFLPVDQETPLLTRCCYHWLIFNLHAEKQAKFTYRIEALEQVWDRLQQTLGFHTPYEVIKPIPKTINTRKHRDVTWEEVRDSIPITTYREIVAATKRYGYPEDTWPSITNTDPKHSMK